MRAFVVYVLGFTLMAGAGYYYRGLWEARRPVAGFCCMQQGSACTQTASVDACRTSGGGVYDVSQSVCDIACGFSR
jgi:hypothetical protein